MPDSTIKPAGSSASRKPHRPQISLALMLLMMCILCAMLAAMFYASRVPAISAEVYGWFGKQAPAGETDRRIHLSFLLFTYSSPLLLAGILSGILAVLRWISPEPNPGDLEPKSPWDDEFGDSEKSASTSEQP